MAFYRQHQLENWDLFRIVKKKNTYDLRVNNCGIEFEKFFCANNWPKHLSHKSYARAHVRADCASFFRENISSMCKIA